MAGATGAAPDYDHHRGAAPLLRVTSRWRTAFFVTANFIGFLAVNAFWHYLSTGRWVELSAASYRQALAAPLGQMLLEPLSIFVHPWMIVVTGLLVAAVTFVPVMVAVLYRLWIAALFVAAVALVGHAPLLAAFLAVGCFLAGRTRLRSDLPFLALLAGLAPVVVYLYFFAGSAERLLMPLQRPVFYLPLLLALVAAVVAGAAVLGLARLTQYRPGVIWPVLLALVAVPVGLFARQVGLAELDYALIVGRIEAADTIFTPETVPDVRGAVAATRPASAPATAPTWRRTRAEPRPATAPVKAPQKPGDLTAMCNRYLAAHPDSPHAPAVMWIRAVAVEDRIRRRTLRVGADGPPLPPGAGRTSLRELYRQLAGTWEDLALRYADSPQAMVALQRLGMFALRDGRVHRARQHLRVAQSGLVSHLASEAPVRARTWRRVFVPCRDVPGAEYYRAVLADTNGIIWLVESNKVLDADSTGREAFADYMKRWPFTRASQAELDSLARRHADTELADNFRVRAALAEARSLDRATKLADLAGGLGDGAIVANYELGRLGMTLADDPAWGVMGLKSPGDYFEVVCTAWKNPYLGQSREHLAWLARQRGASD